MRNESRVAIKSSGDIVTARQRGRVIAAELGFDGSDLTVIATAISEIARNIVDHAKEGEIVFMPVLNSSKHGIRIIARDEGPGIRDLNLAMEYGYSTRNGMGIGLPGAKWLMDEFEIDSKLGKGTTVSMIKWMH